MDGAPFGAPGFARLNFATRRDLLDLALDRLSRSGLWLSSTGEKFFAPTEGPP
jgi:hypothetical protein